MDVMSTAGGVESTTGMGVGGAGVTVGGTVVPEPEDVPDEMHFSTVMRLLAALVTTLPKTSMPSGVNSTAVMRALRPEVAAFMSNDRL
jgi:hypothetical protein